jgi:hypothetical protein
LRVTSRGLGDVYKRQLPECPQGELLFHEDDIDFIQEYIDHYDTIYKSIGDEKNISIQENYYKDEIINTNDVSKYLNAFDATLITLYKIKRMNELMPFTVVYTNEEDIKVYDVWLSIICMNRLILLLEDFLGIDKGITSKIYAAIGCWMWKISMPKLTELSGDLYYINYQNNAVKSWEIENPNNTEIIMNHLRQAEELLRQKELENPQLIAAAERTIHDAKRRLEEAASQVERIK